MPVTAPESSNILSYVLHVASAQRSALSSSKEVMKKHLEMPLELPLSTIRYTCQHVHK